MEMDEEGLLDKARDIQMMRVTRDLLQRLHERDLFSKDTREKETLDNTIEFNKKVGIDHLLHNRTTHPLNQDTSCNQDTLLLPYLFIPGIRTPLIL